MKKIETRFCDECAHADYGFIAYPKIEGGTPFVCLKGHKPRFYKPRNLENGYLAFDWGYKRRCEDFEPEADTGAP